ncbi:hypothetical protein BHE74_00023114 [Ensete ventricosum]|nr:hypothetical protein BHE74_00023114 [Ensete ventricosum]
MATFPRSAGAAATRGVLPSTKALLDLRRERSWWISCRCRRWLLMSYGVTTSRLVGIVRSNRCTSPPPPPQIAVPSLVSRCNVGSFASNHEVTRAHRGTGVQ